MKKLLILLLFTISAQAQYVDVSFDPNKAFVIIDNPRTEVDHKGLDFDIEIGAVEGRFAGYLFWGMFPSADYQNYGLGMEHYFIQSDKFSLAAGPQVTMVLRKYPVGIDGDREAWGPQIGYAARLVGVYWFTDRFGMSGRFQYQRRPDLSKGIFEGSIGLRYNIKIR